MSAPATSETRIRRHDLTPSQAQVLAGIEQRRRIAVNEWNVALQLVGLEPANVVGGNLADDPHFIVKDDAPEP